MTIAIIFAVAAILVLIGAMFHAHIMGAIHAVHADVTDLADKVDHAVNSAVKTVEAVPGEIAHGVSGAVTAAVNDVKEA